MAGEQYNVTKVIRNGDEYYFPGAGKIISKKIFGTGSDGDCVIEYCCETRGNIFLEAKEYNFNNLTICPNVKLRFCGNGVPILRVKECFLNRGLIELRNPLLNTCPSYGEPYLQKIICSSCNNNYACANYCYTTMHINLTNNLTLECLSKAGGKGGGTRRSDCSAGWIGGCGGYGGGAGCKGCAGCKGTSECCEGGNSIYSNAGGGGGGGNSGGVYIPNEDGYKGCDAPSDGVGGRGGNGGGYNSSNRCGYYGGGGGGGYGYCKGGDGGDASTAGSGDGCIGRGQGGNGGNSYIGNGGNGGNGYVRGCGGCSYYGNGGCGVFGGCSYYGNGGCGWGSTGGCSYYGNGGDGSYGGSSIFGNSGCGAQPGAVSIYGRGCGCQAYGLDATGNNTIAWRGIYGFGLFATSLNNVGCISGRGGDATTASDGAQIYIAYHNFTNSGSIDCRAGSGNGGVAGFLCTYQL